MFFVVHKKWMRHRNTLQATSTYSVDQLSSLTHWLHSPRPPSPASLFIIYSCVCSAQVSANPPALLTPDKSFAFIFIFHASTLTAFVLDLLSWKDEKQGKKINVSLNSLSLMWLYIFFSFLSSFISFWRRCTPPWSAVFFLCASLFYLLVAPWEFGIMKSADRSLESEDLM